MNTQNGGVMRTCSSLESTLLLLLAQTPLIATVFSLFSIFAFLSWLSFLHCNILLASALSTPLRIQNADFKDYHTRDPPLHLTSSKPSKLLFHPLTITQSVEFTQLISRQLTGGFINSQLLPLSLLFPQHHQPLRAIYRFILPYGVHHKVTILIFPFSLPWCSSSLSQRGTHRTSKANKSRMNTYILQPLTLMILQQSMFATETTATETTLSHNPRDTFRAPDAGVDRAATDFLWWHAATDGGGEVKCGFGPDATSGQDVLRGQMCAGMYQAEVGSW